MKELLKRRLPFVRRAHRRLSRLRWLAKLKVLRYSGARLSDPASLRYLLWDPEVESHTYRLENVDELVAFCTEAFAIDADEARRHVEEAYADPELTTELRRRTRWAFDVKTEPPIAQRVVWWVLVRSRRPRLVVETGIYEGLGSLVLLVALERNAAEGGPADARLLSIDSDPAAGRLVPERLRGRWEKVVGYTSDVLEAALAGREVDVLFHDTPHTEAIQELEFGLALARAAPVLTLVDGSGGQVPTLGRLAAEHGTVVHHFTPRPAGHPYRPHGVQLATFRR